MPTYEYRCPNGHQFELYQQMSDDPVDACPDCGAAAERQISGGAGFLFKGDGFYITDYRSEEYKKKASAEGGAASGKKPAEAGSGSKGDAAAKTDSSSSSTGGSAGGGAAESGGSSSTSDN